MKKHKEKIKEKPRIRAFCKNFSCVMSVLLASKKENLMTKEELEQQRRKS